MPRIPIAMTIPDLSAFARALHRDLALAEAKPGHLGLLNMLARAAGYGNFQHLRAARMALPQPMLPQPMLSQPMLPQPVPPQPVPPQPAALPAIDAKLTEAALRAFDAQGRMARWPARTTVQRLCLWVLWAQIPSRRLLDEPAVNAVIDGWHTFGDRAILRRSLIEHGLARRSPDGREYRRTEIAPPPEVQALIRLIGTRRP